MDKNAVHTKENHTLMISIHFCNHDLKALIENSVIICIILILFISYDRTGPENWISRGDSDVGDMAMLVTLKRGLIWDVGDRRIMLASFFVMLVIFSIY